MQDKTLVLVAGALRRSRQTGRPPCDGAVGRSCRADAATAAAPDAVDTTAKTSVAKKHVVYPKQPKIENNCIITKRKHTFENGERTGRRLRRGNCAGAAAYR